jgi:hypothetical protein
MTFSRRVLKLLESDIPPYLRTGSRGLNRKRMTQVPDVHRADPQDNEKVEHMRNNRTETPRPLSIADVEFIKSRYNISDMKPGDEKNLGTSNMTLTLCPITNRYNLSSK